MRRLFFAVSCLVFLLTGTSTFARAAPAPQLLRVILIPADGGTEDGTKADYEPIFRAITKMTGIDFEIRVGQSYSTVVEAMCSGAADIAFVGPVTYIQANQRHCADLLAVAVEKGQSIYYAGIFAKTNSSVKSLKDLKGKRVAFGDINSTSSFVYPMTMIMDAGLDPVRDLSAIRLTGSHANSLAALVQGQVDASALSFDSFDKAIGEKAVDPNTVRVVAKSGPIPYPPIVMNSKLSPPLKATLRKAFADVNKAPGVTPDMIRGYGGAKVDRYDTAFPAAKFNVAAGQMARLTEQLQGEILAKASQR
jgi:phosphonate transport system substrate-binding protein